jgi:NTP pyrophosphatase (non-canonical NTP hydrolase)
MARLRAPGGCPWDREQSFDSIRKYTLEETYEVFDAIERRDFPAPGRGAGRSAAAGSVSMRRWRPTKAISPLPMCSTT